VAERGIAGGGIVKGVDGGTEGLERDSRAGPKVPSEAREARNAGAPSGVRSGGNFQKKLTLKSRIFRHFCKLKWFLLQWLQGRIR